jgi:hypothetical protein
MPMSAADSGFTLLFAHAPDPKEVGAASLLKVSSRRASPSFACCTV